MAHRLAVGRAAPTTEREARGDGRFRIDVYPGPNGDGTLARDVRRGLQLPQKALPPKYFYDDRGARLFDTICDLPEYYVTRTEQASLERVAGAIVAVARPAQMTELGSGASRKTRVLLDACERAGTDLCYVPIDISEGMLRHSARTLLRDYPHLRIHAVVADYENDLACMPPGHRHLVLFLGSTIGNLTPGATATFLAGLRRQLADGDHLLLGVDLVKPISVLEAAYNDRAGVTAEFNRNILRVVNRELDGDFDPGRFEHVAFFNGEESQVEMHLRARRAHTVSIRKLALTVRFAAGETIRTEISRKFTAEAVQSMLSAAGFTLRRWDTSPNNYFGHALARVT